MKLKFIVASLLAAASFGASAGDASIGVVADGLVYDWNAVVGDGILSGGHDLITFTGLSPGTYDIVVSVSGQKLNFNTDTNLNGAAADLGSFGKVHFAGVEYIGSPAFVLDLAGTAIAGANYSGTVSVTAVPEPETYGMLLGGLAVLGAVARRKAKKAA